MAKDYQILKQTLTNIISNSALDIGGIYFVCRDVFRDVEEKYFEQINAELIEESRGGNQDAESVCENRLGELPQ